MHLATDDIDNNGVTPSQEDFAEFKKGLKVYVQYKDGTTKPSTIDDVTTGSYKITVSIPAENKDQIAGFVVARQQDQTPDEIIAKIATTWAQLRLRAAQAIGENWANISDNDKAQDLYGYIAAEQNPEVFDALVESVKHLGVSYTGMLPALGHQGPRKREVKEIYQKALKAIAAIKQAQPDEVDSLKELLEKHPEGIIRQKAAELLGVLGHLNRKMIMGILETRRALEKDIAVIDAIIIALNKTDKNRGPKELAKTERLRPGKTIELPFNIENFRAAIAAYLPAAENVVVFGGSLRDFILNNGKLNERGDIDILVRIQSDDLKKIDGKVDLTATIAEKGLSISEGLEYQRQSSLGQHSLYQGQAY